MSAPTHYFSLGELPDGEGQLRVLVQSWDTPVEAAVLSQSIETCPILHGECNILKIVTISNTKRVLCCERCMLRISLPLSVQTIDELRQYLVSNR